MSGPWSICAFKIWPVNCLLGSRALGTHTSKSTYKIQELWSPIEDMSDVKDRSILMLEEEVKKNLTVSSID
jgi:hypothetical protein